MGSEPKDKFLSHNSDEVISIDSSKPEPGITKLADFPPGSMGIRSFALTGLFILALFYTLYFARVLVLPIMLALLLTFLLRPVVRSLKNFHIPEPLSAALVLLTFLGVVGYGAYQLSTPASEWIAKAPQTFNKIEDKLRVLRKPVTQVSKATEQVQNMANRKEGEKTQVVELQSHNLRDILLGQTSAVITGAATMFILLYFLLASGDLFLLKLVKVMPTLQDKKRAVEIAHQIQQQISTYLFTVTLINSGLGLAIGVAMYF
ncbi:MAG: AI-2E family transporter, partial [Ignavibacteriales bacterium]